MMNTNTTTIYMVAFFHGGDYEIKHDIIGIYSDAETAEKAIYEIVDNAVLAKAYDLKYETYFKFFIIPPTSSPQKSHSLSPGPAQTHGSPPR